MKQVLQLIVFALAAVIIIATGSAYAVIADSVTGFSGTQGLYGWYYGEWAAAPAGASVDRYSAASFTRLAYYNPAATWGFPAWMRGPGGLDWWPFVGPEQTQPSPFNSAWAIRRWVSTVTGTVMITGVVQRVEGVGGDGIRLSIMKNASTGTTTDTLYSVVYAYDNIAENGYSITTAVSAGDTIDFIADRIGSVDYDRTKFTAQIDAPVADSVADFSNTQGGNNWYYGEWYDPPADAAIDDYETTSFTQLAYYNPAAAWGFPAWMRGAGGDGWWPFIGPEQAQPRSPGLYGQPAGWSVRRWISDYTGTVLITGVIQRVEGTGGNGIRVSIMKNAAAGATTDTLYSAVYAYDDNVENPYGVMTPVAVGDKIDFIVDSSGDLANDRTKFTAQMIKVGAQTHLARLKSLMAANPRLAEDDYIRLGIAIAERFTSRLQAGGQPPDWSDLQTNEVEDVLDQTEARITQALSMGLGPQIVPRPTGGPVAVNNGVFYSDTTIGGVPPVEQRPCYFNGYGVFGQVAADIPNFRDLGVTLVAQERGPNSINSDGSLNESGLSMLNILDSAAQNGIKVDLLLSPHYFPQWAIDQAPDVIPSEYVGLPNIHIDHPKAREVIQMWLEAIVTAARDKPALFSLNLANEPDNHNGGRDQWSRPRWIEYLQQKYATIGSLNTLYGTNYGSFEEVPPGTQPITGVGSKRAYYDWIRFNQYHFADWFRWMNGIIKGLAPNVQTHIKVLANFFMFRLVENGNDPELLCEITDLAGNDAMAIPENSTFDLKWEQMWYDLLHSFKNQPVFNSEDHIILDGTGAVSFPSSHVRSVLWQGALHHRGASTFWVWEEPVLPQLEGSIYLRPANIYAAGKTMLDLNRLAPEVSAISQAEPKVALLYSIPSWFWETDYIEVTKKVYAALMYLGQHVTFVSERQLAEGNAAAVDSIILPHTTHVQDATVLALERFIANGGQVVRVGSNCPRWDEYERLRTLSSLLAGTTQLSSGTDDRTLMTNLSSALGAGMQPYPLYNVGDGQLAWGVEYRAVPYGDGVLAPMINFTSEVQSVRLSLLGTATDLLSGEAVDLNQISLEPMTPRLLICSPYTLRIADSAADFSNTQGGNNWYYGEWYNPPAGAAIDDYDATSFTQLAYHNPAAAWGFPAWMRGASGDGWWPFIGPEQTQPRSPDLYGQPAGWSVRRWVSNYAGTVVIAGVIQRVDGTGGNGIRVSITKNATAGATDDTLYSAVHAYDDNVERPYSIMLPVAVGDKIDFIVDSSGDLANDRTKFTAQIWIPKTCSLSGRVELQHFVGGKDLTPVLVELVPNPDGAGVARAERVYLDADNNYLVSGLSPGTYDVYFSASRFLRRLAPASPVTVSLDAPAICDVSLTNGDVNGDNEVTSTDVGVLLMNLDQMGD